MLDLQKIDCISSATTINLSQKPINYKEPGIVSLLDNDKRMQVPQGWPTSSKRVKVSLSTVMSNGAFDMLPLACSVAFFVLALVVNHYD